MYKPNSNVASFQFQRRVKLWNFNYWKGNVIQVLAQTGVTIKSNGCTMKPTLHFEVPTKPKSFGFVRTFFSPSDYVGFLHGVNIK